MKKMKRLAALFLAVVMVMAMGMTAAAEGKTITVKNTVKDATYSLYKIFNVTTAKDDDGKTIGYNYSIPSGSGIESIDGFSTVFKVTGTTTKYVTLQDNKNATDIAEFLNNHVAELGDPVETKEATENDQTLVFDIDDDGYYYVHSTSGSDAVAMFDTAIDNNLDIIAKNDLPGWGNGKKTADKKTYDVGETIHYTLSYNNALNYAGGDLVTNYNIEDKPVVGTGENASIKIKYNTINVKVGTEVVVENGQVVDKYKEKVSGVPTADVTTEGFRIVLTWGERGALEDTFVYGKDVPKTIEVKYDAVVLPEAKLGNDGIKNEAVITYNSKTPDNEDKSTETVYTGQITIDKYKTGEEATKLKATFVIATDADATNYLVYNANAAEGTSKYSTTTDIKAATKYITGEKAEGDPEGAVYGPLGGVSINGLKAGKYYLKEIEAPEGYNLLEAPILVELSESKAVVDAEGNPTTDPEGNAVVEVYMTDTAKVANSTGTILPSTGGIGTTIFYVVGGILVLGAAVLLITKKRMSARN